MVKELTTAFQTWLGNVYTTAWRRHQKLQKPKVFQWEFTVPRLYRAEAGADKVVLREGGTVWVGTCHIGTASLNANFVRNWNRWCVARSIHNPLVPYTTGVVTAYEFDGPCTD